MKPKPILCVIAGPTAVGKTTTAIALAKAFNTCVVSADSRQFYKEMNIGTAKPTTEELAMVPHHFVNSHSIHESYSAGDFMDDAMELLPNLFEQHQVVVLCGGSGLFINALLNGLDTFPDIGAATRQQVIDLYKEKGLSFLQEELERLDPLFFEQVDQQNPQRMMRALEVCYESGEPFSKWWRRKPQVRFFDTVKIALDRPRAELHERINKRVDLMMAAGQLEEVKRLKPLRPLKALETVGYQELFDFLDGEQSLPTAIELIKRNSRRYAKRQLTWFRRDGDYNWCHPDDVQEMEQLVQDKLQQL